MRVSGLCPEPVALNFALARKVFRPDIFEKAKTVSREGHKGGEGFRFSSHPSRSSRDDNKFPNEIASQPAF